MRGRLINWLLTTRLLCWLGLHMPVASMAVVEDELVQGHSHCAACERQLCDCVPLDDLPPGHR